MCCHMTQDHTSNHATLNFRLLCKQRASSLVFPDALALRPPSVFSASFRMDIRLHLKRKARVLIICRRFTSVTRARGRCFETRGRPAGVSVLPSPNAAPIVEQRRKSKQKLTRSVQKLFRSFLVSGQYQDTGGYQRSKLANWIYVRKCVIGTSLSIEGVFTSLFVTSR